MLCGDMVLPPGTKQECPLVSCHHVAPTTCCCKRWIWEEWAEMRSSTSQGCFTKAVLTTDSYYVVFSEEMKLIAPKIFLSN